MPRACAPGTAVFATTPYEADEAGELRAVLPSRCVFAADGEVCSLFVDHRRERKTGPCMPLAVVGCSAHPVQRYTLYPPGHVPHGREPVVATSVTGALLREAETGKPPWEATVMSAAVDAARGERWASVSPAGDARRRRTQGRRLQWVGRLVGVHPSVDDSARERIATRLGVPTMTVRGAAGRWARRWTTRGAAIVLVLLALSNDALQPDRILAAGAVAGVWVAARRWDPARASWVVVCSEPAKRPGADGPGDRGPPPTTSPDATTAGFDPLSGP
jgi:hypothetical protein